MSLNADGNVFTDLSGTAPSATGNPYDSLLEGCKNDRRQIQLRYETHRNTRNGQQKAKMLSPDFAGFMIDPVLELLLNAERHPGYVDPRNCLVIWARPTSLVKELVANIQKRLDDFVQGLDGVQGRLWLMPPDALHMTALEITHSKTPAEIQTLAKRIEAKVQGITDYTYDHRARLIKPLLSYDGAAIALSFLPAADEESSHVRGAEDDAYTYHHLRQQLFNLCEKAGVAVESRYVVPSAHLTIARFVSQDIQRGDKVANLVGELEAINRELQQTVWPGSSSEQSVADSKSRMMEWVVGEEKGLECRRGTLWYGGGERVCLGRGFTLA